MEKLHILKRLHEPRIWSSDQSWHYQALWTVDDRRLRVHIRRNAFDVQSWAKVEWFDATRMEWNTIHSVDITFLQCRKLSYTRHDITVRDFAADEEMLLDETMNILFGPDEEPKERVRLGHLRLSPSGKHMMFSVYVNDELMGEGDLFAEGPDDLCEDGLPSVGGDPSWVCEEGLSEVVRNLAIEQARKLGMKW